MFPVQLAYFYLLIFFTAVNRSRLMLIDVCLLLVLLNLLHTPFPLFCTNSLFPFAILLLKNHKRAYRIRLIPIVRLVWCLLTSYHLRKKIWGKGR